MALVALRSFKGEIPKSPAHLLPDGHAQYALNCDFSTGVLRPMRAALTASGVVAPAGPVTALYFRDVSTAKWYSSASHSSRLYRSPVVDDVHKRVYMLVRHAAPGIPSGLTNAHFAAIEWDNMTAGGEPSDPSPYVNQCIVGVPTPTVAPELTVYDLTDRVPGMTLPSVEIKGFWDADGVKHAEEVVSTTTGTGPDYLRRWTVTAPDSGKTTTTDPTTGEVTDTGTPPGAVFGVSLTLNDTKGGTVTKVFTLTTTTGASIPARTSALPGGVEMTLTKDSTVATDDQYTVTLSWGVVETRAYVFTVVNEWSEESAPSNPALISLNYLQKVRAKCAMPIMRAVGAVNTPSERFYQKRKTGAAGVNLYRTFGGSSSYLKIQHGAGSTYEKDANGAVVDTAGAGDSTAYPRVQANGIYAFIYDDVHVPTEVGLGLVSLEWDPPPDGNDTISLTAGQPDGLVQMQNGWFAMFRGNTLHMSEPNRPHAWPYTMTFPSSIVACCPGTQELVVATQDAVFVVNGAHPAAVSHTRLPVPVGGVSQRGICNVDGAVALVTNDGILLVSGTQASLAFSQKLFTREVWKTRYGGQLANMRLSYHDGALVGSFPNAFTAGFIVRTDEDSGSFTQHNTLMYGAANYPEDDSLVFTTNDATAGKQVFKFRASGVPSTMNWWSKEHIFTKPEAMGAFYLRMENDGYSVTVTFFVDGVAYYIVPITTPEGYYRIPSQRSAGDGFSPSYVIPADGRGLRWSVQLTGQATVKEFLMAQTMAELKSA